MNKLTKETLEELYINKKYTMQQIADMYDVKYCTVHNLLSKFKINRNSDPRRVLIDYDTLYDLYVIQKKSVSEITSTLNCCAQTIHKNLKHYNILNQYVNFSEDQICKMYVSEFKSLSQIKDITNIPKSRIRQILLKNEIQLRNKSACQCINIVDKDKFINFDYNTLKTQSQLKRKCQSFFKNHIALKVKELRGNKCEICGSTKHLHAHHLYPQSLIISNIINSNPDKSEDELYNIIISDETFLDFNNIKVVCERCHYTIFHPYVNYNKNYYANQQPSLSNNTLEGSETIETTSKVDGKE